MFGELEKLRLVERFLEESFDNYQNTPPQYKASFLLKR